MADQTMKRLNYFDHQFLRARDFNDEQSYHLSRRYLHNSVLHTAGIAQGLQVKKSETRPSAVTVESGIAIDRQGREIILNDDRTLDLLNLSTNTPLYVYIEYKEQQTDQTDETGTTGSTRWTEDPVVASVDNKNQITQAQLVLAKVSLSATGGLEISGEDRVAVGVSSDDLIARTIRLKKDGVSQGEWPKLSCSQANEAALTNSSLRLDPNREITFQGNGQLSSTGDFTFRAGSPTPTEKLRISANGNVNVGSTLHVGPIVLPVTQGRINVSGATAELSFVRRSLTSWPAAPAAGDRFVWYNPDGTARLWTEVKGDLLAVTAGGNVGIGTTDPQRRLQVGGDVNGIGFEPSDVSPNAGYIRFGDATGWKLHIGRSRESSGLPPNSSTKGVLMTIQDNGNVGIGTSEPSHRLHVNDNLGIRQNRLYLGGGDGWSSLSYNAHHNANNSGWVFPDQARDAVTIEMDDTPAGGKPRLEVFSTTASARTKWVRRFSIDGATGVVTVDGNLTVSGDITVNGKANIPGGTGTPTVSDLQLDANREIFFKDNGQIRSLDNNHRILFRRSENKLELREIGDLIFSPGASAGNETAKVVMAANGNVNVGSTLHVGPIVLPVAQGRINVSGSAAEISFMKRTLTSWPAAPAAGDRFVWYNPDGTARLWTEVKGDLLAVAQSGNIGIGTTTNLDRPLSIKGTGGALELINFQDANGNTKWHLNQLGGVLNFAETGVADNRLAIKPGGHVSISGTSGNTVNIDMSGHVQLKEYSTNNTAYLQARDDTVNRTIGFTIRTQQFIPEIQLPPRIEPGFPPRIIPQPPIPAQRVLNDSMVIDGAGNVQIKGSVSAGGGKTGYVVDKFVNKVGETLELGDVVVIGKNQATLFYGMNDYIPIPEIDFTDASYDTRICGVVCEVHVDIQTGAVQNVLPPAELTAAPKKTSKRKTKAEASAPPPAPPEEPGVLDKTKVGLGQVGLMVTLGTFAYCKVDADIAPIEVGDLLTTSPTKGHAQKVLDPAKAVGAILGKALGSLKEGTGKIPIMVTLQ